MSFFVVAPEGMLGRAWVERLRIDGEEWRSAGLPEIDLLDESSLKKIGSPNVIVNCAAYTNVDGAETDEETATKVNGVGVGNLARYAESVGATLLHYGTDYVFSGDASAPYPLDAPIDPVNAYGRSKAEGERQLRAAGKNHLNIRTSWLYAPWGQNFVLTMKRLCAEKDALRVVDDQRGRPTSAQHLAEASLRLWRANVRGDAHITDGGECTWHGLTSHIADWVESRGGSACDVTPCTSDEYPRPAKRPAYSVLDLSATEAAIGPMPDWKANVTKALVRS